jgi:hypothetical protein
VYIFVAKDVVSKITHSTFTDCLTGEGNGYGNGGGLLIELKDGAGGWFLVEDVIFKDCHAHTGGGLSIKGFFF